MRLELLNHVAHNHNKIVHSFSGFRSLSPLAGEIVGARLMRRLGIGAPDEIRIVGEAEARAASDREWVVKGLVETRQGQRLKFNCVTEPSVLVRRILGAISIRELRWRHGIEPLRPLKFKLEPAAPQHAHDVLGLVADALYAEPKPILEMNPVGFILPADTSKIQQVIAWDSDAMLEIHAARLLLACSTAHVANVLVDSDARLYSVDHEMCNVTDGSDIAELRKAVTPGSRVWRALANVAASLDRADIERLFDDLPEQATWPLGDKAATVGYYKARLILWRAAFTSSLAA